MQDPFGAPAALLTAMALEITLGGGGGVIDGPVNWTTTTLPTTTGPSTAFWSLPIFARIPSSPSPALSAPRPLSSRVFFPKKKRHVWDSSNHLGVSSPQGTTTTTTHHLFFCPSSGKTCAHPAFS